MKSGKTALRGKDIRKGNEKLVLRLIQQKDNLSQSEVVEITGLKAPTILRIFNNLEEQKLIQVTTRPRESVEKKGRKPVFYTLNPEAGYIVGVEFWSDAATVVISNLTRETILSQTIEINKGIDGQQVLLILKELIENAIKSAGIDPDMVIGVGLGAPGRVDTKTGKVIYYSRINGLVNFDLKTYLEENLNLPVYVNNNCSVIAMNEYNMNTEIKKGPIMAILIRGGVGGAYINDGKVLTAGSITTVELGHISVDPKGRECSCGRRGCLETYLSEGAILEDLSSIVVLDSLEELEKSLHDSDDPEIQGKVDAFIREKGDILSHTIQNLNNLFSPESYLIISRSRTFSEDLVTRVKEADSRFTFAPGGRHPNFIPVEYNPLHAGMGACDLVFSEYFRQDGHL
ncbi:MAG: ROK family protein [Spirochaetales bacterium]|nr:ROK family protein [Spirochaetales bacterium]